MKYVAISLILILLQGCISTGLHSMSSWARDSSLDSFGQSVEVVRELKKYHNCKLVREISKDDGFVVKGTKTIRINKLRNMSGALYGNVLELMVEYREKKYPDLELFYAEAIYDIGDKPFAKIWKCSPPARAVAPTYTGSVPPPGFVPS